MSAARRGGGTRSCLFTSRSAGRSLEGASPAGADSPFPSARQVLLVDYAGDRMLRVDDVRDLELRRLAEELVRLDLVVPVVLDQPVDEIRAGEPERVHQRAGAADRHDLLVIDQPGPVDLLPL